jgi:hydroxymethylglutaryl-CoA reductase (NADPH)
MQAPQNFSAIKESFNSTSRFARLSKIHVRIASRYLFIRFVATTGDAMGMNMLSKVSHFTLKWIPFINI